MSVASIKPLRERLDGRYLAHLLSSQWVKDRMVEQSRGDMIPHIVLGEIREFPVPLPPLPEQCRLVRYLDGLSAKAALSKQLEAARR